MQTINLMKDRCPAIDRAIWDLFQNTECPEDIGEPPDEEIRGLSVYSIETLEETDEADRAEEALFEAFVSHRYNPAQFDHSTHGCDWATLYGIEE